MPPRTKSTYGIVAAHASLAVAAARAATPCSSTRRALRQAVAGKRWIALGAALRRAACAAVLPWGSDGERERSERLRRAIPDAVMPPRLTLDDVASVLAARARAPSASTPVSRISPARSVSATVGLYMATDPSLTGLYGCKQAVNLGGAGCAPSSDDVLREVER